MQLLALLSSALVSTWYTGGRERGCCYAMDDGHKKKKLNSKGFALIADHCCQCFNYSVARSCIR